MSLSEILTSNPNPWANLTINNLEANDVDILGDLTLSSAILIEKTANINQATNITTAVTATGGAFQITTQSSSLASASSQSFTINNESILLSSYVFSKIVSYSGTPFTNGVPFVTVSSVSEGSCVVTISNYGANALAGTFVLQFLIF